MARRLRVPRPAGVIYIQRRSVFDLVENRAEHGFLRIDALPPKTKRAAGVISRRTLVFFSASASLILLAGSLVVLGLFCSWKGTGTFTSVPYRPPLK